MKAEADSLELTIDGMGNRLCRAACMTFCPPGDKPNPNLACHFKEWLKTQAKLEL